MFQGESISVIKKKLELLQTREERLFAEEELKRDNRVGVRKLGLSLEKKRLREEKEVRRILHMKQRENQLASQGKIYVGGIDEAGRGPLAGPVVAACIIMNRESLILEVNDSKKIKEDVRENLFDKVIADSISFGIGIATNEEIDRVNILQATFLAMKRAVQEMAQKPEFVLVDGNQEIREFPYEQETVVQGDSNCYSIACASILAKVYRDRLMRKYDVLYPEFEFGKNKGYGTAAHYEALRKWGITPIHRRSFLK